MSPRRLRLRAALVVVAAAVVAVPATIEAEDAASYFSYRFGGSIYGVGVGLDGTIYVAGTTEVPDLPASTSTPDPWVDPNHYAYLPDPGFVFVAALEPDGRPRWTSYVRDRHYEYDRYVVTGLAIAPDGSVWIAGNSQIDVVNALPTAIGDQANVYDGWVAKFDASGTLQFASHVLTQWTGIFEDIAVTPAGDAVFVGSRAGLDLPGAPSAEDQPYSEDAFVMSLRADGGGVNWSRRFRAAGTRPFEPLDAGSVAIDPTDATILATFVGAAHRSGVLPTRGLRPPRGTRRPPRDARIWSNYVARLEPGGAVLAAANLRFLGTESPGYGNAWPTAAVAAQPDGTVLVAGTSSIARLSRGLTSVETAWDYTPLYPRASVTGLSSAQVCTASTGRTFVVATRDSVWGYAFPTLLELDDARRKAVPLAAGLGFSLAAVAFDGRGDLVAVGEGTGLAFNAPSGDARPSGSHLAKVPLAGERPPGGVTATVRGPNTIDVAWIDDGHPVLRYEIERVLPMRSGSWIQPFEQAEFVADSLLTLPGTARTGRVTSLASGADHAFRVVAVYPSGVALAAYASATTPPLPPLDVRATRGPGRTVTVAWDEGGNGDATKYDIQWRYEADRPIDDAGWKHKSGGWRSPYVVDLPRTAAPLSFRVRAVTDDAVSQWSESAPLIELPTLRVHQTTGRTTKTLGSSTRIEVEGRVASADPAMPLAFDPSTQSLEILVGYVPGADSIVIPAGDPNWTRRGTVLSWHSPSRSLGEAIDVGIDVSRGRFHIVDRGTRAWGSSPTIAVDLAFGTFSGGDIRRWRTVEGPPSRYVLR